MKLKTWRMKWWRDNYCFPHSRELFKDIATCPVCTQDKPVDAFTPREISHIASHIKNPLVEIIPQKPEAKE